MEYHGPHLSTLNDALLSEGLARLLVGGFQEAGHDWPWRFAGQLGVGADPVIGPGSEPVPYRVVRRRVLAACRELHAEGARRVLLCTFHGAPLHNLALEAGARWLRARGVRVFCPMNLLLRDLVNIERGGVPEIFADHGSEVAARLPYDVHAGFLETSLTLHLAPTTVQGHREVEPCPLLFPHAGPSRGARLAALLGLPALAAELDFLARGLAWYGLRPFPGYSGAPHLASAEAGRALIDHLLPRMTACALQTFLEDRPAPAPVLAWLGPATLWGVVPRSGAMVEPGAGR